MMQESGISEIIGCDRQGAISTDRADYGDGSMTAIKKWFAENTNPEKLSGGPDDVIEGCDLFIGLSGPGLIQPASLGKMNDDAIVFAMANPTPEVMPEEADAYVRIMATAAPTIRTRSTTSSAFRASSAARSTPGPLGSPRR